MKKNICVFALLLGSVSFAMNLDGAKIQENEIENLNETDDCNALIICDPKIQVALNEYESDSLEVLESDDSHNFLISYIKNSLANTCKVINLITQNPQKAQIIGLWLAYNITAAAALCDCYCWEQPFKLRGIGYVQQPAACISNCRSALWTFYKCEHVGLQ